MCITNTPKMQEILKENFDAEFPNIEKDFQNALFFAIDNEFSGLLVREELSHFDTMEERYQKQVRNMKDFISLQIGISAFHFSEKTNTFQASTYCFYIFPQSFGAMDLEFFCKTSSFEFLRHYDFDFNKLVYHGVPYLSHQEEKELRKSLSTGELLKNLDKFLSYEERSKIQNFCSEISEKIASLKSSGGQNKSSSKDKPNNTECNQDLKIELEPFSAFVTYHEIRQRFPGIIIHPENYGMRLELLPNPEKSPVDYSVIEDTFKKRIIYSLQGFTRIFDLLIDLKKPIVGHNMFSDLLMMCKQFHGPLPSTLQDFKKEVHELFPTLYDTKFFCQELKRCQKAHFKKENAWKASSLQGLYDYFQDGFKGVKYDIPRPTILKSLGISIEGMYHNAGWDSYCAGYIFIRMTHLFAVLSKNKFFEGEVPTGKDYMSLAKQFSNRVNIIMGNIFYIVLDDEDPSSHRPTHLFVRSRTNADLDIVKVAKLCSSYGTTDVKPLNKRTALIGIGSRGAFNRVMENLRNHPEFIIERYSVARHNPVVRFTLWTTFGIVTSASAFLLLKILPQIKK